MEIEKVLFDRIRVAPPDEQEALLKDAGFELLRDATSYHGKIVDSSEWLSPDFDKVENYLRGVYEDLDEADDRIEKYETDYCLSEEEQADFKNFVIADAQENEYHPGLFFGEISYADETLVVATERTGGAWDCQAKFVGIFPSVDEALDHLSWGDSELI